MKVRKFKNNLRLATLAIAALFSYLSPSLAHNHHSHQVAQTGNSSKPTPQRSDSPFSDISKNVYKPEILEAFQLQIIQGFPDGTFRPNQPVTREQAV